MAYEYAEKKKRKLDQRLGYNPGLWALRRSKIMTSFRLRKNSFYTRINSYKGLTPQGVPKYVSSALKVRGEVFSYLGKECGIYRTEHTTAKRKYDYIAIDLASGREICRGARKLSVLTSLERDVYKEKLLKIFATEHYHEQVEEFRRMKEETINAKNQTEI